MKKTLIAIMALASMAHASTIITFGGLGGDYSFVTDAHTINDVTSYSAQLSDGNSFTLTPSASKLWGGAKDGSPEGTWLNTTALEDLNTTLGTSYSATDFGLGSTMYFTAPGNNNSFSTLTFDFSNANVGDSITMYAMVTACNNNLTNFSVSGLDSLAVSYATNSSDGFSDTAAFSQGVKQITMIKITGEITDSNVVLNPSGNKSGFQSVAYQIVPEPSTAVLSLLALAGLAVRRRRK